MYLQLDYEKTFTNMAAFIRNYNANKFVEYTCTKTGEVKLKKDLKTRIRSNHKSLLETLIREYAKQLNKAKNLDSLELPSLAVNNVALANATLQDKRSILNLLNRLLAAKIITKQFRGTYADFFININTSILYFKNDPQNEQKTPEMAVFEAEKAEIMTENSLLISDNTKTLPLILEYKENINKEIANAVKNFRFSSVEQSGALQGLRNQTEKAKKQNDVLEKWEVPGEKMIFVALLSEFAQSNLFHRLEYLSQFEQIFLKKWFFAELDKVQTAHLQAKFEELMLRMLLVNEWINKDTNAKYDFQKRFVPIPSVYFSNKTEFNFDLTAKWFKEKINNRFWYMAALERTNNNLKQYLIFKKHVSPDAKIGNISISDYKKTLEILDKKGLSTKAFQEQILN